MTGWVRNTDNNKVETATNQIQVLANQYQVEGEAQGEEDAITAFLKDVDKGPSHAHVVKLEKQDRDVVEGEKDFEVRR